MSLSISYHAALGFHLLAVVLFLSGLMVVALAMPSLSKAGRSPLVLPVAWAYFGDHGTIAAAHLGHAGEREPLAVNRHGPQGFDGDVAVYAEVIEQSAKGEGDRRSQRGKSPTCEIRSVLSRMSAK